ncbi:ATP/maltotriose-dependent transcriptional regulator MalT [Arthrobacter sp. PvP023]|uniref:LuxR family transcriptional regulator n=1 Tax=Micrococcaceae TaxID=1268 RepID=UPI001AE44062|nr:LuxR family transcriptional regulator [Arthrobacter sp. PvP023]MBP1136298.1 ATP/maltotriose-dependent transcriptional regulator MalT [Arthrobacter sp. PvP023]
MAEQDLITSARAAYARRDWPAARNGLLAARTTTGLELQDLAALADSMWWLGDIPESLSVAEDLYRGLAGAGDRPAAAMKAILLSLQWGTRGDLVVASGWLNRARRLLQDLPEGPEHGYLLYLDSAMSLDLEEDPGPAQAAAARLDALANRLADPTLGCFARVIAGLGGVRAGRTEDGFSDLDEAMLPVLAGAVAPVWAGDIYCTVIHLCHQLGDLARMRAWTGALEQWTAGLSATFVYTGVTRIHELQLVSAEGGWDAVEREIGASSDNLVTAHGWMAGAGYYELGEVRRLRGNAAGALAAYRRARDLGVDPQPGEALLHYEAGDTALALNQLRASLGESRLLDRARLLPAATELALVRRDAALAEALAAELERTAARFASPGLQAWACQARGAVLLASGRADGALPLFEAAARTYRAQRARYRTARIHELLAESRRALGHAGAADADLATALAIYRQLGAVPDVERLERAGDRAGGTAGGADKGGLTAREREVLALITTGASNRQVADALVISEKTVGRHLANIFAKIGVSTRTAAAGWARDHGLA